uniref:Slowpoke-binding protein n=1 Tax=Timema cristinae TaxID=61476 RepID=A0A7R9H5W7_TIMCR|nr:unnamed protein product [Timema cristinae]
MLNLYKNISRQQEKANKEQVVTGHDRYCQERPTARSSHRRRRPVTRRALSASEFDPRELADANARTRCARSASTDDEDEVGSHVTRSRLPTAVGVVSGERTPLLSNKLETLGRIERTLSSSPKTSHAKRRSKFRRCDSYKLKVTSITAFVSSSTTAEDGEIEVRISQYQFLPSLLRGTMSATRWCGGVLIAFERTSRDTSHDNINYRRPGVDYDRLPRKQLHRSQRVRRGVEGGPARDRGHRESCCYLRVYSWKKHGHAHLDIGAEDRHGGRYQYTALEPDSNVHEKLELEKKNRERAQNACLHYLRACPRYAFIHQLNDIGSRVDKHWFVVRDTSIKTERLLTLVPRGPNCPIQCNPSTRDTILNLFLALQHPYIYPVLDLDFRDVATQTYVILVLPFNNKGSLKDLIYKSKWQDDWGQKYSQRSAGLPLSQVQRLGRQVLEALLFLKDRGFPPCSHLHSGNIILQNGVARITGLENTLLGFTSRIHPVIWSRAREEPLSVDAICFGHVLFEMCAGYELCAPEPSPSHLQDLRAYPQVVEVLDYIFQNPNHRCPSIEELLVCDFFRNIDLREMRAAPLPLAFQARLTASTISLLNEIKKHQSGKRPKRSQSSSTAETTSPSLRDRR